METKQRQFGNIDVATDDNSIGQSQFDDTSTVETNLTRKDFVSEHWSGLDACLEGTDDFVFVVCDKNRDHWGDAKKLFKETSEDVYVNFRHAASCNEEARKQFEACLTDFFPSDERDPPATIKTSASQVTLQKHNKREGLFGASCSKFWPSVPPESMAVPPRLRLRSPEKRISS